LEREAVFFLNLSFSEAAKGEDLISAVMLEARMEGEPVRVPTNIQPCNPM